jgi:hypothetical protein
MTTGYTPIGTVIQFGGVPFALATDIKYPEIHTTVLDDSVLSNTWKEKIPSKLIEGMPFDVTAKTTPTALATLLALQVAGTVQAVKIDFTDGDTMSFNAIITAIKPGQAVQGATLTERFVMTLTPSGTIAIAPTTGFWYTPVDTIAVKGGDIANFLVGASPLQMEAWATVAGSGFTFRAPDADLTWTSGTPAKATLGANTGILTWVAAGATACDVKITAKTAVNARFNVTAA